MLERFVPLGRLLLLVLTTTVIVLSFCGLPAAEASSRTCVSALVTSAFRLPDGELHPAGRLTLCRERSFSPVAELHRISVNRRAMGMFFSQSGPTESKGGLPPEIVFGRDRAGNLELLGYTVAARGWRIAHRLSASPAGGTWNADEAWRGIPIVAAMAR